MSALVNVNPYLPMAAEVTASVEEAPGIVTLRLRLRDDLERSRYRFAPGQFNMLYMADVGEVPISISSDPSDTEIIDHTIRAVGRVTEAMARVKPGEVLGLRGPFGRGWPMDKARGRNILVITGGIGCAPTASVVGYAHARRDQYGAINVLHGVRKPSDMIFGDRFNNWCNAEGTVCMFASQEPGPGWTGRTGLVTGLLDDLAPGAIEGMTMMCGPEPMMRAVAEELLRRGRPIEDIYVSMERSMQCGLGHCGHCQYGPDFICKDGPVFPYEKVRRLMNVRGF
jgi:NAD(P)H-flavin reductase